MMQAAKSPETLKAELEAALAGYQEQMRQRAAIESGVRQMVEYFHTLEYTAYLKRAGKLGMHHIRSETCMNHGARSAYMPGWNQRWNIMPSEAMLAAIGYGVVDALNSNQAQREKDATQPTVQ